jgi:succinate dehydrogenase / fumarate reductase cytochrome b subunit
VALSGLLLWIWIVLPAGGNLTLFGGPARADGYAAALQRAPGWLWAARCSLAAAAIVHVAGVITLARASRRARPHHRGHHARGPSALAAHSMGLGGALLLAFVGYHVLHLTFGVFHPHFRSGRVYANVVVGLHSPWVAAVYVAAAAVLGLHLFHGLWAAARSLGIRPDVAARRQRPAVAVLSAAVALGFASVPIAVLIGWLR